MPQRTLCVEKRIICDSKNPGIELFRTLKGVARKISLYKSFLSNIIGLLAVAAAQGQQKPPQRLLYGFNLRYELLFSHRSSVFFLGQLFACDKVNYEKADA